MVCCEAIELDKGESKALGQQISSLRNLIDRSMLVGSEAVIEADEKESSGPNPSASTFSFKGDGGEWETRESSNSLRSKSSRAEMSDDEESVTSTASSEGADVFELSYEQIECLMELVPTLEESLASIELSSEKTARPLQATFSVSRPAQAWVQGISEKFREAPVMLVERLGEANWQRFVAIRARMAQVSTMPAAHLDGTDGTKLRSPSMSELEIKDVFVEVPRSIFISQRIYDPIETKTSRSKLLTKTTAPRCESHDEPCKFAMIEKPGANYGRSFWTCAKPLSPSGFNEKGTQWRCRTFYWCNDRSPSPGLENVSSLAERNLPLLNDVELGSSMPPDTSPVSRISSMSDTVDGEKSELRGLRIPAEAGQGKPFRCEFCGYMLSNIRTRRDWKFHVFGDLQPYICTFSSCSKSLVKFSTRARWADHEFNEHRVDRAWKCLECGEKTDKPNELGYHLRDLHRSVVDPAQIRAIVAAAEVKTFQPIGNQKCPLCMQIPGVSRKHFVGHVARHLEDIALAALPQDVDKEREEQEAGSEASSAHSVGQDSIAASDGITDGNDNGAIADGRRAGLCPLPGCGLYFKDLKAHSLTHQAERPEKCPIAICEYHTKGFARKYDQAKHTLTHFRGTLTCPFCPLFQFNFEASFTRVDVLKRHLTSVHGVQQTSSTSRQKSQGGTHLNLTGVPIPNLGGCSTCPLTFDSPQAFYDHLDACIFKTLADLEPKGLYIVKPQNQGSKSTLNIEQAQGIHKSKWSQRKSFSENEEPYSPSIRQPVPRVGKPTALPPGWFAAKSNSETYYYNINGESTWTKPTWAVSGSPHPTSSTPGTNRSQNSSATQQLPENGSLPDRIRTSYSEETRRALYGHTVNL